MKKVIITGISGQDGSYLAKQLLDKGYKVIGLIRNSKSETPGLSYLKIKNEIELIPVNLEIKDQIFNVLKTYRPDFIYNLAAESSVAESFINPHSSIIFNLKSTLNLLESIRELDLDVSFYQATSSEMYGSVATLPINEKTLLYPQSPYAVSKAACHYLVRNYRESYQLKVCSGILFNHESVLRRKNFFIMKLFKNALDLKYNKTNHIQFGNINIKRDFGYAKEYVKAMILMAESPTPDDYLICSGTSTSLKSIVEYVFDKLDLDYASYSIDPNLFRPAEIEDIYGDNSKAKEKLKWEYNMTFFEVIDLLLEEYSTNIYDARA